MAQVIKKVFAQTLKEMMEQHSLNKITVSDLTQACGVSRQTFYNNFHDIYELVEWIYLYDISLFLDQEVTYENWQATLKTLLQYIEENRYFVLNTYHSVSKPYLEIFLYRKVERFLTEFIFNEFEVSGKEAKQVEFSISFYTYALVGVILDWIEHEFLSNSQEMVEKIEQAMRGTIVKKLL